MIPAGSDNRRVVEKAAAALPGGIHNIFCTATAHFTT
jgi:hypothetical protein